MKNRSNNFYPLSAGVFLLVIVILTSGVLIYSDTDAEKILRSSVLDGYKDQLKELQVTDIK